LTAATPYPVRAMLRTYGRQVTTARRLARYRRLLRPATTPEEDAAEQLARETRRDDLVRRVAAEIIENCLVTGSDSPVVDELKADLEEELGFPIAFAYPPEEQDMQILRLRGPDGPEAITGVEKSAVLKRLWDLALEKVDATML